MERIVAAQWRLRRRGRVEAGIFAWELYEEVAQRARREAGAYEMDLTTASEEQDYGAIIMDEEKHREALSKAREMEAQQETGAARLGRTFIRDADGANAFSKLSRYETAIERSLYRALHELQRLQAARRAQSNVSPPLAVDVDVSGLPGPGA